MVRKLDELGRIVIPIEFRNSRDWKVKDEILIIENDNEIILKKYDGIYCKKCNTALNRNDRYCRNCGRKV